MMTHYRFTVFLLSVVFIFIACDRKSDYVIDSDLEVIKDNGTGTGTTTWTPGKQYLLDGLVFVNDGQTLTIEAGTVIRGKTGQGEQASALIVARGAKIIAQGTAENPIIFTCENDDLVGSVPLKTKGLWGGIIILGNANLNIEGNEMQIEGIPYYESRGVFGGTDDDDNSGILEYVSIRHGGTDIGEGNEINGLTLGGVGRGTTIEFVEIIATKDDGIEFFGGTVGCKFIVSAFNEDDAFDYDLGYSGYGQFWLAIQDPGEGDLVLESGGGQDPELGLPYSLPVLYNGTFIGRGSHITNHLVQFNQNAGGRLVNSLFLDQLGGITIQYKENSSNSYSQFTNGNLEIKNNIFWDVADNIQENIFSVYADNGITISEQNQIFINYFAAATNTISDPGLTISPDYYWLIPLNNVSENLAPLPDSWFNEVNYKGAFGTVDWTKNWTLLHQSGLVGER
jgi:hypothetical protein